MNITIFGSTGESGQILTKKALERGYHVKAYARNPSKFSFTHNNLEIVKGELNNQEAIENAVKNTDAVISLLGPTGSNLDGLSIPNGIQHIIISMRKYDVQRLIATSTPSFKVTEDSFQFSFSLAIFLIKILQNSAYLNIIKSAEAIANSNLNWTIVRLPMLSNNLSKGHVEIGYIGDGNISLFSLTREDLSNFLINQIEDRSYIEKAPAISN